MSGYSSRGSEAGRGVGAHVHSDGSPSLVLVVGTGPVLKRGLCLAMNEPAMSLSSSMSAMSAEAT